MLGGRDGRCKAVLNFESEANLRKNCEMHVVRESVGGIRGNFLETNIKHRKHFVNVYRWMLR